VQSAKSRTLDYQSCGGCTLYKKLLSRVVIVFKIGEDFINFILRSKVRISNNYRLTQTGRGPQSVELHSIQNQAESCIHKNSAVVVACICCDFEPENSLLGAECWTKGVYGRWSAHIDGWSLKTINHRPCRFIGISERTGKGHDRASNIDNLFVLEK